MPSTPRWKNVRLADELRRQIADGTIRPGRPMPSITELAGQRGWSRGPCRIAMQKLEAEGLLLRRPGRGYYVI
jgi:GntR family transcriptional regulator